MKKLLFLELLLLFFILPLVYYFNLIPFNKIIPLILLLGYCSIILIMKKDFSWKFYGHNTEWKFLTLRFGIVTAVFLRILILAAPKLLFSNLRENPAFRLKVIAIYPLVSVIPQEIIYRKFFFHRYEKLFRKPAVLLSVNVVLFSFAHIWFMNWQAVALTLAAGLISAHTYLKYRSLALMTAEHTVYGILIFVSGMGEYFFRAIG